MNKRSHPDDQALEIKPDDHQAWYNRGIALGNLGRDEQADRILQSSFRN
jgi:Flp pilus assembly protein TadD